MKWYGKLPTKIHYNPELKNYHRRVRLKARSLALDLRSTKSYKTFTASVYLPENCKYTYLRNHNFPNNLIIHLSYMHYFSNICFPLKKNECLIDPLARSVTLIFSCSNNYFTLYWLFFNVTFHIITQIFYHKLKFRGKGYYVYKNYRNVIAFQFGYAHRVKIYLHFINVKFLSKISVFFYGLNHWDIFKASHLFFDKRPINIFTGRGVRFTRQIIYRKAGKISTYR